MSIHQAAAASLVADGGVISRNPSQIGGTYYWLVLDAEEQIIDEGGGVITPREAQMPAISNNLTELLALVAGLERLPYGWVGSVLSDSQVSLGRLFWGWKFSNIPPWLIARTTAVLQRIKLVEVQAVLLDGHPTKAQLAAGVGSRGHGVSRHNVYCDEQCRRAAAAVMKGLREEAITR